MHVSYVCTHEHMQVCMYIRTCACMYIRTRTYAFAYVYVCVCVCLCVCVCVCVHHTRKHSRTFRSCRKEGSCEGDAKDMLSTPPPPPPLKKIGEVNALHPFCTPFPRTMSSTLADRVAAYNIHCVCVCVRARAPIYTQYIYTQTKTQTDRQTDRQTHRHTHTHHIPLSQQRQQRQQQLRIWRK
jgi:hypothetical protein